MNEDYMKQGWEIKKLGEVCEKLTDGSHNPPKGILHSNYIMLSSQNVYNDKLVLDDVRFLHEDDFLREDKRTCVREGDVLLTIVGTIGRSAVFMQNINVTLQRSVAVLRPHTSIISRFLMYCLIGKNTSLNEEAHGIAQKGIYLKQLAQIPIPVPPLPVQEQIVSELDLLSGIIEKKREQLKELDALAQSIFYDMFGDPITNEKGWEVKKLNTICDNLDYQRKPITAKDRIEGEIPYYGASGIVDHVRDYIFDGDFLLVSEDGANLEVRHTPIAFPIKGKTWVNNHAHILRFKQYCTQVFMEYYINLMDISYIITGCAQPKLTQANLNNINVFDTPLNLQHQFATKIEAIEKQKELIKQSISETETLFNARMQEHFG